jgi:hypothetical protein
MSHSLCRLGADVVSTFRRAINSNSVVSCRGGTGIKNKLGAKARIEYDYCVRNHHMHGPSLGMAIE